MKKITFIFALLCASVMSWAYTSAPDTWIGTTDATYANQFKWSVLSEVATPNDVVNIQQPGFATAIGIYMNFADAAFDGVYMNGVLTTNGTEYKQDGAGIVVYLSALTAKNTEVLIKNGSTTRFGLNIYNDKGTGGSTPAKSSPELSLNETTKTLKIDATAETFQIIPTKAAGSGAVSYSSSAESVAKVSNTGLVTAEGTGTAIITVSVAENESFAAASETLTVEVIDWSQISFLGTSNFKIYFTESNRPSNYESIHIETAPWAASNTGIYVTFPDGVSGCSLGNKEGCWIEGAQVLMYLSAFTSQITKVTITHASGTKTLYVYNADGEPEDLTGWNIAKGKTSVAGYNAQGGHAAANDGNKNSRWSSEGGIHYPTAGAQDWWYVDLGGFYSIETIKILYEGAYPNDYDLLVSNNAVSWTIIGTYTATPKVGNTDDDYNVYDFSVDPKVGRYVKIFARNGANIAWGISMWEFEVYGDRATLVNPNAPVMTSASLSGDPTYNQVNIAVAATDEEDGSVAEFHVVDASKSIDQVCISTAGVIAVTGLSEQTSYSFTITALDAGGLESENNIVVAATTSADPTMPAAAAPVPSGTNKDVLPIYSDAFSSILAHDFSKNGFDGSATLYQEKNISGDHMLVYDLSSGPKFVIWGHWDGSDNEIRASAGYQDGDYHGVDVSEMEYMHVDIWSLQACNSIWVNINDVGTSTLSHNGEGWQGFDIPMSGFDFSGAATDKKSNNVRWLKFRDFTSVTGKLAIDNVYFWKAASGTKSVSATPNHSEMGTATVKRLGADVTEVETGSTVTFSAVANEGYLFVNWSNGNTNATFDAEVTENMLLTANFRAINHISCNEEMTNGDYTVYVTYRKTANENEYEFIVRSAKVMTGFSNAYIGHINGNNQVNLNDQGSLTGNGHKLAYTFTSTTEPKLNTPLYVNFANHGEVTFNQINNGTVFEFAISCADPEITAIALNKTEATLDMGNTLTLVPSFTPAYMSADITWQTSDDTKATVSSGVVTPVAPGDVTITAKVSETVKATCAVTVQTAASHNWYGYGTDKDLDYTYRIEYTTDHHIVAHVKRQGNKTGLVNASMNINNNWTDINVTEGEEEGWKKGTTAQTYTAGAELNIIIQSNYAGASSIIQFSYTVGADNVMPTIVPSVLKLSNDAITMGLSDEDIQLTTEIHHRDAANQTITWTSDDENVVTVENGLVHPVGVGTTTIHASTFNGISESCDVTVVGELEPATFWGNGVDGTVAIAYSITRNANHTLTYTVEAIQDKVGFVVQVNDGNWHTATLNEGIYSWTSEATYTDGDHFNGFFYMPFEGGAARVDFVNYEVGSESARRYIPITVVENADNSAVLTANDEKVREVTVTRSFTADKLYTLVLPFDVDAAQTAEKLPGILTKLNNSYIKENGDLRINFVNVAAIEAGVPYLYEPSADVANPTFESVTVSAALNPTEPADNYAKYYGIYAPMDGDALHAIANAYVLGPDQYLYAVSDLPDNQTMAALRGYFVLNFPDNSNPSGAPKPRAKVVFNSHETNTATGIEAVSEGAQCTKFIDNGMLYIIRDGKTYNVQGQLVK